MLTERKLVPSSLSFLDIYISDLNVLSVESIMINLYNGLI